MRIVRSCHIPNWVDDEPDDFWDIREWTQEKWRSFFSEKLELAQYELEMCGIWPDKWLSLLDSVFVFFEDDKEMLGLDGLACIVPHHEKVGRVPIYYETAEILLHERLLSCERFKIEEAACHELAHFVCIVSGRGTRHSEDWRRIITGLGFWREGGREWRDYTTEELLQLEKDYGRA